MARGLSRIIRTYGQSKREERGEPFQRAFGPAVREQGNPKPERAGKRAFGRIQRRVLILSCAAVAVTITAVSLFLPGNGSGDTRQAMAVYEAGKDPASQTSFAPDAASVSAEPSASALASLEPSAAPVSSPSVSDSSESGILGSMVFQKGMTDPLVALIQQRLMDLSYLNEATPTELYGPLTQAAVISFQRAAGLPTDGCVGSETYTMLISPTAPLYSVGLGAQGADVEDITYRLRELGYLNSAPSTFTEGVKTAVEKFQERNGLSADGTVGKSTKEVLFSSKAKKYAQASGSKSSESSESTSVNLSGNITQKTNLKPSRLEAVLPSALKGLGEALYNGEAQYKINSLFVLSIINYESGNGTSNLAQHQNNLGGIKQATGGFKVFATKEECVEYMFSLLRTKYINEGLTTVSEIGKKYSGGDTWATRVTDMMQDLIAQYNG